MRVAKIGFGALAASFLLFAMVQCNRSQVATKSTATSDVSGATLSDGVSDKASVEPRWDYSDETDEMSGAKFSYAQLESTDSFVNEMGSRDPARTKLEIQKKHGSYYVEISNPNLQFMCSAFTDTYLRVKFDEGPARSYACTEAKTSKYGVAFILNAPKFLTSLKRAKHLVIEAEVFQRGLKTMHWDLPPLEMGEPGRIH